ncbi:MAG: GNAT family N-acetyltransferase [Clostridia bacterium]|nr:GNAT family N-acetyltransferase [Clostridia bacterium]
MFPLNIQSHLILFKDIKLEHLPQILEWYNKVEDFKFATGIGEPITLERLRQKYAEVAICSREFFVGIYLKEEPKMIGILKGSLKVEGEETLWISSIVIDPVYQNKGFGKMAVNLLLDYLKMKNAVKSVYIAVIEENIQGRAFWEKQNFKEIRKIENHFKLQNKRQNVIIMSKKI